MFKLKEMVIVNNLRNRWNIPPCGTIEELTETTANVNVFNLYGPGADMVVFDIPLNELGKIEITNEIS
jgi:hypothetical protein